MLLSRAIVARIPSAAEEGHGLMFLQLRKLGFLAPFQLAY